jgi:hypothetical protein
MLKVLKRHAPFDIVGIYDDRARSILRYAQALIPDNGAVV